MATAQERELALLSVYAAAIYFVPPTSDGEAFPWAQALGVVTVAE